MAGINLNYVPYKGTGPALTAALAGEVNLTMVTIGTSLPYARNGRLRALGVSSARRSALAPDIPTIAEAGVPGLDVVTWYGLSAPRDLPAAIVNALIARNDGGGEPAGIPRADRRARHRAASDARRANSPNS